MNLVQMKVDNINENTICISSVMFKQYLFYQIMIIICQTMQLANQYLQCMHGPLVKVQL
jgi:hypothetical protein